MSIGYEHAFALRVALCGVAGGDHDALADIGVPIARFVRITDRAVLPGSFDLDAVGIVNAQCP